MELPPRLAAVAARHDGLFTTADALDAGYSAAEIKRLLRRDAWARLRRGVYIEACLLPGAPAAVHRLMSRAVLLRLHEPANLSHLSAVAVHDIALFEPDWSLVHVTRSDLRSARTEAGVHHHAGRIPPAHVGQVDAMPITSVAWSLVDLARESSFAQGLVAAEAALWAGRVTIEALRDVLFSCVDWPGARTAGRVVSFASDKSQTPGETLARIAFEAAGLPQPEQQVELHDRRGFVARVDFLWRAQRTVGEFDGRLKYEGESAQVATLYEEKLREDRLRELGFQVVRFGFRDVLPGRQGLGSRVRAAFARAERRTA